MELNPYVDNLRRALAVAAETGGEDARALAERLTAPLESAIRLTLLDVLSAATGEITRDLAPGSVEVRLRGRDPDFVVTSPLPSESFEEAAESDTTPAPSAPPETDEGGTSRITLRMPEHLKPRIEEAAAREGLSVNAWLVRAVSACLEPGNQGRRSTRRPESQSGRHITGWVR